MLDFLKSIFSAGDEIDLNEFITDDSFLVDVRTSGEFASGHPKGSLNIPLDTVEKNIHLFKGKSSIVVFCRSGNRSGQAKNILESQGIKNVVNGGTWQNVANVTDKLNNQ